MIIFACDNELCDDYGLPQGVERGDESTCPKCGWFMQPLDEGEFAGA